jgi:hypothetical protein
VVYITDLQYRLNSNREVVVCTSTLVRSTVLLMWLCTPAKDRANNTIAHGGVRQSVAPPRCGRLN